jgi:hypothetical protein
MARSLGAVLLALPLLLGMRVVDFANLQVRVEGYLGATAQQAKPWEMLDVQIGTRPVEAFAMTNIIVLTGAALGADVLQAIEPIHPNLILNGDPNLLAEIASAKPNQLLKITGYTAFGPQRILVTTVEMSAPITGPTPTPSLRKQLLGF